MQIPRYTTGRLRVQDWSDSLTEPKRRAALLGELSVLQNLPPPLQLRRDAGALEAWVRDRAAESTVLTLRNRDSGDLLGLLILACFASDQAAATLQLGYLLGETAWGKGYASELLQGLVDHLRRGAEPLQLRAGVAVDNPASARELQKAGFTALPAQGDVECDVENVIYGLTLPGCQPSGPA